MLKVPLHSRFSQQFRHERGWTFRGVLQNVKDQKLYNDDYFYFRQILRVDPTCSTRAGSVVHDSVGNTFLLGELELTGNYRSFRCYPLNKRTEWRRNKVDIDPLTQIKRATGGTDFLGHIWVLSELLSRELPGGALPTREDVHRVLTGAKVELGDIILGQKVIRINEALGVRVLEIA